MATLRQLSFKNRIQKRRRCKVAALLGAPTRKGVVVKMAITTPRKPNSAKRKYAKIRVIYSKKVVHAHIPGQGPSYIQDILLSWLKVVPHQMFQELIIL